MARASRPCWAAHMAETAMPPQSTMWPVSKCTTTEKGWGSWGAVRKLSPWPDSLWVLSSRQQQGFHMPSEAFPRFDLQDQVVLITGAARGIGRAAALACAHAGGSHRLGAARCQLSARACAADPIDGPQGAARTNGRDQGGPDPKGDSTDRSAVWAARRAGEQCGGRSRGHAIDVGVKDFDEIFALNVKKSTFFASQAAAKIR